MNTIKTERGTEVLCSPLTRSEMEEMMGPDCTEVIRANVAVGIDDLIEGDIESFDDIVSEAITGTVCLQDIEFHPIDVTDDHFAVVFEVSGYVDDSDLEFID